MSDSVIRILPPEVANRIAAGEVVERPASVVKELVENSLDAAARHVRVEIAAGGTRRIEVDDDGCGMSAADAVLCLKRHATSKIRTAEELHAIASFGFRGEALPSIAAVGRLCLDTAIPGAGEGVEVEIEGGENPRVHPSPPRRGTRVLLRDLFFNMPARRRFLRTERTEEAVIVETMRALALANAGVGMRLLCDGRLRLDVPAGQSRASRVTAVMGSRFAANHLAQRLQHEGVVVEGFFGLPTFHHRHGGRMYVFVNGRVVRDRQLHSALKAGYADVLTRDRFPQAVVWIEIDPKEVDVNVHPGKQEVRFRRPREVRAAVIGCVRAALSRMGGSVSDVPASRALTRMRPSRPASATSDPALLHPLFSAAEPEEAYAEAHAAPVDLGAPMAQIHRCYILSQTRDGIVLVDQHAAAERIAYEKMKRQLLQGEMQRQMLLSPACWQPDARTCAWLHDHGDELADYGFEVEPAGEECFHVRAVPALLADEPVLELVAELAATLMLAGVEGAGRGRILERWLGNRACKASIKAGRILKPEEQEALLREMERTPNSGQCNHGRPTYVRLSLSDLERLFGRRG